MLIFLWQWILAASLTADNPSSLTSWIRNVFYSANKQLLSKLHSVTQNMLLNHLLLFVNIWNITIETLFADFLSIFQYFHLISISGSFVFNLGIVINFVFFKLLLLKIAIYLEAGFFDKFFCLIILGFTL